MNPRTARNVLATHLGDPNETPPPAVQKALKAVSKSPELQADYERQSALDARWRKVLSGVEIPDGVESGFAAQIASLPVRRFNPRDPAMLAAAIGFLLLVSVLTWNFLGRPAAFPQDAEEIAERVLEVDGEEFETVGEPAGEVEDWFVLKGFDGFKVPDRLAAHIAGTGGILKIQNQPVAVLSIPQRNAWFVCFPAPPFGIDLPAGEWRFAQIDEHHAAAVREDEGMCFMILRKGSLASVQDLAGAAAR